MKTLAKASERASSRLKTGNAFPQMLQAFVFSRHVFPHPNVIPNKHIQRVWKLFLLQATSSIFCMVT